MTEMQYETAPKVVTPTQNMSLHLSKYKTQRSRAGRQARACESWLLPN